MSQFDFWTSYMLETFGTNELSFIWKMSLKQIILKSWMEPSTTDDEMLVTENVQVCLDGGTRAEVMGFYLKCSTDYVQS